MCVLPKDNATARAFARNGAGLDPGSRADHCVRPHRSVDHRRLNPGETFGGLPNRLAAAEEILPGIGGGQVFPVITDIEIGRDERRFHFTPAQRDGEWSARAPAHGIGSGHGCAEAIAKRVEVHAVLAFLDSSFDGQFAGVGGR